MTPNAGWRRPCAWGCGARDAARTDDDFATLRGDPDVRALLGLPAPVRPARDEAWRADLRFLAERVEHKAYQPFRSETGNRYVSHAVYSREEFEAAVAKLSADIPGLSDGAIEVALFRLTAGLGDGHTAIEGARTRDFGLTLPLGFYLFDDGLHVIAAAPAYADLVGARVIAFDGVPAADVLARVEPLVSRDNGQWVKAMAPTFLRHTPMLHEIGVAKADDKLTLTLETPDGARRTAAVSADFSEPDIWNALPKPAAWRWLGDRSAADFQQGNDRPYWQRWDPATRILYVQYNKVADDKAKPLAAFAAELSATIAALPVEKLVIDMRGNNGGDTHLNEPLLAAVAGAGKINRTGHLYVITGRRTYSAAMNAVSYFGRFTKAIFVGEATGGKPNSPGDETIFTLPYSQIAVNVSDRYWQGGWPDDFADTRAPDIEVPVRFADYAAGRDAAMEVIKAQAAPKTP
ncbi:hypothetical protein [Phenylobacterium sp.]|uniref:hypothetical protein n=1 Tax=Phenylobacterium sp. TaxID=1871053 RepID=UPI002BD0E07F|nr:hypothetical protein [Phenylobacterium sp.]HLZ75996.1 hypothetical protein [Phenylobacterium sp.]